MNNVEDEWGDIIVFGPPLSSVEVEGEIESDEEGQPFLIPEDFIDL